MLGDDEMRYWVRGDECWVLMKWDIGWGMLDVGWWWNEILGEGWWMLGDDEV